MMNNAIPRHVEKSWLNIGSVWTEFWKYIRIPAKKRQAVMKMPIIMPIMRDYLKV